MRETVSFCSSLSSRVRARCVCKFFVFLSFLCSYIACFKQNKKKEKRNKAQQTTRKIILYSIFFFIFFIFLSFNKQEKTEFVNDRPCKRFLVTVLFQTNKSVRVWVCSFFFFIFFLLLLLLFLCLSLMIFFWAREKGRSVCMRQNVVLHYAVLVWNFIYALLIAGCHWYNITLSPD